MKKHLFFSAILILLMSYSCSKDMNTGVVKDQPQITKSSTESTVHQRKENPYSLEVMQSVYDSFSTDGQVLKATDLYVKFKPQNEDQLYLLKYVYGLELFDYPLDIDLRYDENYIESTLPDTDLTWVYTTVKPDFIFPDDIPYEVIEECYIPKDGETIKSAGNFGRN